VANPQDILQFHRRAVRSSGKNNDVFGFANFPLAITASKAAADRETEAAEGDRPKPEALSKSVWVKGFSGIQSYFSTSPGRKLTI